MIYIASLQSAHSIPAVVIFQFSGACGVLGAKASGFARLNMSFTCYGLCR